MKNGLARANREKNSPVAVGVVEEIVVYMAA